MDAITAAPLALPAIADPIVPLQTANVSLEQPVMKSEDETVDVDAPSGHDQPDVTVTTNDMPVVHYYHHNQFKADNEQPDLNDIHAATSHDHDPNQTFHTVAHANISEQQTDDGNVHVKYDASSVSHHPSQIQQPLAQQTNNQVQDEAEPTPEFKTKDQLPSTFNGASSDQPDANHIHNVPHHNFHQPNNNQNTQSPAPAAGTNQVQVVAASLISLGREGDGSSSTIMNGFLPPPPNDDGNIIDIHTNNAESSSSSSSGNKIITTSTGKQYTMKPRDPKRDTSISFEEMQRLMRVYGPIKCLRNRTPKETGKALKIDSVKRKFERTSEGWYKPRFGHEEEMQYRADMRKKDQDDLVKKRNTKRARGKTKESDISL
eukprot:scaffold65277_cov26-Cyclotella_meneghiniana.AAC.6